MTETALPQARTREVEIPLEGHRLPGVIGMPAAAIGVIVFAHGSGSTHASPRNAAVAQILEHKGFATLRFDLLFPDEARDRDNAFDIELLAARLAAVTSWLEAQPETSHLPVGFFGASTGAAAALVAAAMAPPTVSAVVSRGGRPDLAGAWLPKVEAPTLLLVGGLDDEVIDLNRLAAEQLKCRHQLTIVKGATHLFEEPGKLEEVARQAAEWFEEFVPVRQGRSPRAMR